MTGYSCSGGQKARITLARAVYSSAEVLLLDDVRIIYIAYIRHSLTNRKHRFLLLWYDPTFIIFKKKFTHLAVGRTYITLACRQMLQGRSIAGSHCHFCCMEIMLL